MAQWLASMTMLQQVFAYIAIAGTTALLIQTALMLLGIGHIGSDVDGADTSGLDHDHAGLDMHDHEFSTHDVHMDHDHTFHDHDHCDDHDHTGDHDNDHDHHDQYGLRPFTLRGFVALLSIMGWSGLAMLKSGVPTMVAVLLAFGMGAAAMLLVAYAIRQMMRLQSDGSMNIQDATGAIGTVYLTIPPNRAGMGKVNILVGDRLVELAAMSDEETPLPFGTRIVVACILDGAALVEPHPDE